jgi:hypothetical protein
LRLLMGQHVSFAQIFDFNDRVRHEGGH